MSASSFTGISAVVTGATGGIGRMIAAHLTREGATVCLVGRSAAKLARTHRELEHPSATVHALTCDLDKDDDLSELGSRIENLLGGHLDLLVHCAGIVAIAPLESISIDDFDAHYRINVRAPLLLTQALLPSIKVAKGQIVFVNSSLGTRVKEGAGAYAASKHALKAVADTLRAELEATGVRVLTAFPGNTATTMQQEVCEAYGKEFVPEAMLQAQDVAAAIVNALTLPPRAALTELHILPARRST